MITQALYTIVFISFIAATQCFAQGESGVPFLLISPGAKANGMGEASVALFSNDPLALMTNPAQIGFQSHANYFSFGYNRSKWLPQFQLPHLAYSAFAVNAGVNLRKELGIAPELSIGIAYSRIYLNLGEYVQTASGSPTPISTYNAYEQSDQYSAGIGIDYWVKVSAGITFKQIFSSLAPFYIQNIGGKGEAGLDAYDYGLMLGVPVIDIISRMREEPILILPHASPFFDFNIGIAKNNLGSKKVIYGASSNADPLPRYARIGIGFNIGIDYDNEGLNWQPVSFKWTIEANDLLVRTPGPPNSSPIPETWGYQDGFGDIKFFDELIAGHTNTETIKKKGWEIGILEFLYIRGGRFEEDYNRGNRRFNTSGFGFQFSGFVKFLRAMDFSIPDNNVFGFILRHVDLRYDHSEYTTDEKNHPLSGTSFNSLNVLISN